jgi:hypothetical protein
MCNPYPCYFDKVPEFFWFVLLHIPKICNHPLMWFLKNFNALPWHNGLAANFVSYIFRPQTMVGYRCIFNVVVKNFLCTAVA